MKPSTEFILLFAAFLGFIAYLVSGNPMGGIVVFILAIMFGRLIDLFWNSGIL